MKGRFIFCVLGLCVALNRPASAQVASSTTLVGTVTDGSGAVVPGASVIAVQDATKVAYKGQSSSTGNYTLPYVAVGTYTLTVEAPSFGKSMHSNVLVEINQTVRTDFVLQVGAVTNEVTVSSAPPPIATDDAALIQTTSTVAIASLPVAGHDTLKLALTTAGVQQSGDVTVGDPPGESFAGPGTRGEQNDVTLDGVTIMNTLHTTVNFPVSPDAIQEVSVQTGTYSAQYGSYLGVHINAVSKTGGNALHGVLHESLRNDVLNAHGRFDQPGTPKNPLRQNQFGAELDGPVVIPKLYNGKNRTFFMFDYQGRRQYSKSSGIYTVMTAAERTGDFSALLTAAKPVKLSDPVNPDCIIANIIQPQCIDPHSLQVLKFMAPPPNLPGLTQNLNLATSSGNNWDQYLTRVDETLNDKARLYFRYAYQKANPFTGNVFFPDSTYSPSKQNNFVVGYTQVFTPNLVNQFQVGRNQVSLNSANGYFVNPSLDSQLSALNIPGYANPAGNPGDPSVTISNYTGTGSGARNSLQTDEVWTTTDSLSWSHGAHNIIAGADISRVYTTRFAANSPRGSFTFNGTMTGDAAADFMRGLLVSDTTPTVQLGSAGLQWRDDFFVVDKWNATRNLTLNIGLRYELPTVPVSPSGIANVLNTAGTALIPSTKTPNYKFTLPNHNQWAPRFGFAYRLGSKWVVRGGFGIYYSPDTTNTVTILSLNPPYGTNFTYNTSRANPVMTFSNPNPVAALGTASPTPDILTIGPYFPSGTMNQWSFDVERSLWQDAALDVQYLGNHTYHLDTSWQENAPLPGPGPIQSRRPNQLFGNIRKIENQEYSNYDGMNVVLTQRMHKGLIMQLNYTWSHSLDQGVYSTGGGQIVNSYDWRADYGNSSDDIRHRFVGTYVWQMPFLRGSSNTLLRTVAGGWSLSGIATIQTGNPVNVTITQDQANTGQTSQRPNLVGPIHALSCGKVLIACVNSNAFALPTLYTYGNAGRNLFYAPGLINFDTSLAKTFRFRERYAFQFRMDAYNTFNHVNWGAPNGTWSSPSFGNITSAGPMRAFEATGRLFF
jgi:Carboxypeptidase regulatory-like domain/TonB-dependent Receptor Plug Domain